VGRRGRIESIPPDVVDRGELAFAQAPGWRKLSWRSSTVEQLICNQQVVGSSPIASSSLDGSSDFGFCIFHYIRSISNLAQVKG
jgi:hypothetical protein